MTDAKQWSDNEIKRLQGQIELFRAEAFKAKIEAKTLIASTEKENLLLREELRKARQTELSLSHQLMQTRDHVLYTNNDKDRPEQICDINGQVVLSLCKLCGKGESQLIDICIPKTEN